MKNKTRDIVVIVISLIIFITALLFIFENNSGGGSSNTSSSDAQLFDKMEVPVFETDYSEEALEEVNSLTDSGIPEPGNLGKENIFKKE